MFNNRFLTLAIFALAVLLLVGTPAHAQDYFYGYYYPNEHRFHTDQLEGGYVFDSTLPTNAFPSITPAPWVKDAVNPREPRPASIRMFLPDPKAKVWFDGVATKSTGAVRTFDTPPLDPGIANHYRIKLSYMQDGREVTQDRTIVVLAGHTAVFHFPKDASKKTPPSETKKK